jgi:hypothetical protein
MARLPRPVHHQEIPVQNAGPDHGGTGDPHLEGRRRVADQVAVEIQGPLGLLLRWRGKAGGDPGGEEGPGLGRTGSGGHPKPHGLGSFLVGCHHQIPHEALVEWLGRNQRYEQESA